MEQHPEIVVNAVSSRYATAFARLLGMEGGFVDDPVDRGGATKYGISLRFLISEGAIDLDDDGRHDFDLDMDGDIDGADIRKLTIGDARFLYLRCFWNRLSIEGLPRPIGEMLFDQAVNGGSAAAGKMLQLACNALGSRLTVDGVIGPMSRSAIDRLIEAPGIGIDRLVAAYRREVDARYRAIVARAPSQRRFLNGWLRRAHELGRGW